MGRNRTGFGRAQTRTTNSIRKNLVQSKTPKKTKKKRKFQTFSGQEHTPSSTSSSTKTGLEDEHVDPAKDLLSVLNDVAEHGVSTDACQDIMDFIQSAIDPLEQKILDLQEDNAQKDAIILKLLLKNEQLRNQVKQLTQANWRLKEERRNRLGKDAASRVWVCFKLLSGCSYKDMRILNRCERLMRNKVKNYYLPSESELQKAYRIMCTAVDTYLLKASDLNPAWTGFYVNPAALLEHDVKIHLKFLGAAHIDFDIKTRDVDVGVKFGIDGAPITSCETWTIGTIGFNIFKKSAGEVFNRLAFLLPYPEDHPAVLAVVKDLSSRLKALQEDPLVVKITQRRSVTISVKYVCAITDWAMRIKLLKCMPAGSIAFTSYSKICKDNLLSLLNKRGDDPSLGLLTFVERIRLGLIAKVHYDKVRKELEESKNEDGEVRTKEQVAAKMQEERLNFSTADLDNINPQVDVPLNISIHMLVEWLHAGLRLIPKDLQRLHKVAHVLYENGFSDDKDLIPKLLEEISKSSELKSCIKKMLETKDSSDVKGPGNMIGRLVNIVQLNLGKLHSAVKDACGGSEPWIIVVTALFYISARHRNIIGLLKQDKEITDGDIDRVLDEGKKAFNVWASFLSSTTPIPYAIALEFEAGALVKIFVAETGERNLTGLSAQFSEHGNSTTKKDLYTGNNWVDADTKCGLKQGSSFKPHWRHKTFAPFVRDYAKSVECVVLGLYTVAELKKATPKHNVHILPEQDTCQNCGGVDKDVSGRCTSNICEKRYMDMIECAAANARKCPASAAALKDFVLKLGKTKLPEAKAEAKHAPALVVDDEKIAIEKSSLPVPNVKPQKKKQKRFKKASSAAAKRKAPTKRKRNNKRQVNLMSFG
jgi:hypothetical protein